MKLIRYRSEDRVKPGLVDGQGVVRDLSGEVDDWAGEALHPDRLAQLQRVNVTTFPQIPADVRLAPPVGRVGKLVCIGVNYADHAAEIGASPPDEPIVFLKATSSICGPRDDIIRPRGATELDYEVELGIVIGKAAKHVPEHRANQYVAGYCIINDVSERMFQFKRGGQWTKGKSCDHFAPIGPWLVTRDEISDTSSLDIWSEVDGKRRQWSNTRHMTFSCEAIVAYLSSLMTLHPGDVIATGTPDGVALGMRPPEFLTSGQTVKMGVAGLGYQYCHVRDEMEQSE